MVAYFLLLKFSMAKGLVHFSVTLEDGEGQEVNDDSISASAQRRDGKFPSVHQVVC